MSAPSNHDWMFDKLLEEASEREVRICRVYEFCREVADPEWSNLTLGQCTGLLSHPELVTPLFWFCGLKPGWSDDWLRAPYFALPQQIQDELFRLYSTHLSALIDPGNPRHDMAFLPVGEGPPFKKGPFIRLQLTLPAQSSNQFWRECFDAMLKEKFPQKESAVFEGGKAAIRQMKNQLRYLGAFRLLEVMSAKKAAEHTKKVLGKPLYDHAAHWSRAKTKARSIIQSFEEEMRPTRELFLSAPQNITSVQFHSGTGKLECS
jgi:hypothetical protein